MFRGFFLVLICSALLGCGSSDVGNTSRAANKYLWNASLETLSFLPLEQADPFSGVLVTGWGTAPGSSREYRATIYVDGPSLDATSLKVAVFRKSGNREIPAAAATSLEVENAILSRARQLRIRDVQG